MPSNNMVCIGRIIKMAMNKRWKREAKRVYGECCNNITGCNYCKYVKTCFSARLNW